MEENENNILENVLEDANILQNFMYTSFINNVESYKKGESFNNLYSLRGSAGTGKTWLTSKIIKRITEMGLSLCISTPTHKSLAVVKDMLLDSEFDISEIALQTIHSFLNLKLDYGLDNGNNSESGNKPKLIENTRNKCLISVDILLIDESSMINEELYNLVLRTLNNRSQIILFVGDEFQLKPVEGGLNPVYFSSDVLQYELTETVRQKGDSSIILLANKIRDYIKFGNYPQNISGLFTEETEHIKFLNTQTFLPNYFSNEATDLMVGSYTNKVVDEFNNYIRYVKIKEKEELKIPGGTELNGGLDFLVYGEELVLQEPYANSQGEVIFQNGETIQLEKTYSDIDINHGLEVWRCVAEGRRFAILDPDSHDKYNEILDQKLEAAKFEKGYNRKKAWVQYFKFKNRYAKVKYTYSSTVHKLQGSTYIDMYSDIRDLDFFFKLDPENTLRLLYVSITRPSEKLYILK